MNQDCDGFCGVIDPGGRPTAPHSWVNGVAGPVQEGPIRGGPVADYQSGVAEGPAEFPGHAGRVRLVDLGHQVRDRRIRPAPNRAARVSPTSTAITVTS